MVRVTGGLVGFAAGGVGVRRLFGCGVAGCFGVEGVVAVGRTMMVGRTETLFTETRFTGTARCGWVATRTRVCRFGCCGAAGDTATGGVITTGGTTG